MRGQAGGQNWERLGRAAARGRGRIVGTTADGVGKAPQSISGLSSLPWKKDFVGARPRPEEPESHRKDPKKEYKQIQPEKVGNERKPQSPGHPGPLGKLQDDTGNCPGQQELARIRTTWRIERLSMRGQARGQNWERLGRAAARGRVKIVGTTADVVGKDPQSIFGLSSLPWKKDFADN